MFGIDSGELLIIAVVALLVIGPKDLPRAMRTVGQVVGKARGMARHFRSGIDAMIREAELEEMEKKWSEHNQRIMGDHPMPPTDSDWGLPSPHIPPATPGTEQPAEATPPPGAAIDPPPIPPDGAVPGPAGGQK